jgi:hypothetical protein
LTEYPSDTAIFRRLRPVKYGIWVLALLTLLAGFWLDTCNGIEKAFAKSGGVVIAIAIISYFLLDRYDYLTGNRAELFDSSNHAVPKRYLSFTEATVTAVGTFVATFGDWIAANANLRGVACIS